MTKNICVFCSANDLPEIYTKEAQKFSHLLVQNGYCLVWGGSNVGLMKVVADACQEKRGVIRGITMEIIKETRRLNADSMIIAKDLSERKSLLLKEADAIVLLVGGIGSLDEVTEILELKKHDLHQKPIVVLNTNNFYDDLRSQLERMKAEGFISKPLDNLIYFAKTPDEAINYINQRLQ